MLTITHLSYTFKNTDIRPNPPYSVPYIDVNCTFKVEDDGYGFKDIVLSDSREYFFDRCAADSLRDLKKCQWRGAYTFREKYWHYLEKFDTFWFKDCVADCYITRNCLMELEFYKSVGRLPTVYRHMSYSIVLRHLKTLSNYWD